MNTLKNDIGKCKKENKLIKFNKPKTIFLSKQKNINIIKSFFSKINNIFKRKKISQELSTQSIIINSNNKDKTLSKLLYFKNKIILSLLLLFLLILLLFVFFIFNKSRIYSKILIKYKKHRLLDYSNNYDSYATKKNNNYCKYFIDGKDYFQDLYEQLLDAKETIYIADFHLNPELFLIRPVDEKIYIDMAKENILSKDLGKNISRIMDILDYKARQGVKIYILLFHEWVFVKINSKHTVNTFKKLNQNITVIRFPNYSKTMLWTNHEKLVIIDNKIGYVGGYNLCWGSYDTNKHPIYEEENKDNIYEFPFLDYDNLRIREADNVNDYTSKNILKFQESRLPWHDIHARIDGPAVEDISKHFFDRWNYAMSFESKNKGIFPHIKDMLEFNVFEQLKKYLKNEEKKINYNYLEIEKEKNIDQNKEKRDKSEVQVLRSIGKWNTGLETEDSILKAYYELIKNAKHYIYIENQFFISKSWTNEEKKDNPFENQKNDLIKNEISLYIRRRIEQAYENNENFKVFIFLPLVPAFPSEIDKSQGLQIMFKHTYKTICRNNGLSLIEQLEKKMGDKWKNYIHFFSLRTHGIINNRPKTEILYIHSKLLIVDDTKALISSANINDRSLIGNRDSEFGVLIEEEQKDHYIMNGNKNYKAAKFAVELRKKLMAEHLGINIEDSILDDPVDNKLFELMISNAKKNTQIYHDLFKCYPDDEYTTFELMSNARRIQDEEWDDVLLNKYMKMKDQISGNIVEFPLNFLKDEKLGKILNYISDKIIPEKAFT